MLCFEVLEDFPRRADPALFRVLQTLTDTFFRISSSRRSQPQAETGLTQQPRWASIERRSTG